MGAIYYEWKVNDRAMANIAKTDGEPGQLSALYYKGHTRRDEFEDVYSLQVHFELTFALAHIAWAKRSRKKDLDKATLRSRRPTNRIRRFDGHYILGQFLGEKGKGDEAIAGSPRRQAEPRQPEVQMNLARRRQQIRRGGRRLSTPRRSPNVAASTS